jgi:diketogulonate reductase-like aldo/keto reductase
MKKTYDSTLQAINTGYDIIDTAPLYGNLVEVGRAIKDSMTKLNVNYIHEILLHEPVNYKENWKLLSEFYQIDGKNLIGSIGVSNFNQNHLQDILDDKTTLNPIVNQIEVNPFLTRKTLTELCIYNSIEIVAHSPLAKGELFYKPELKDIANVYNVSPAQSMLKWGIQKGCRVIPRSKDCKHIEENINLDFTINDRYMTVLNHLDCGYSIHPKYLTPIEKKIFKKLRAEYKRKRQMKVNFI